MINKHDERVNSREDSAVAEAYLRARGITETQSSYAKVIKMAPVPSLEPDQQGTLGWSRMYSLTLPRRVSVRRMAAGTIPRW